MLPRPNTLNLILRQLPHYHAYPAQIRAILRELKVQVGKPMPRAVSGQIRRVIRIDMQKEPRPRILLPDARLFDIDQRLAFGVLIKINIEV